MIRRWTSRPRPENYLPFSTTHQHKAAWRWPFLAVCACLLVVIVLVMILLGQQARFDEYIEENRTTLCALYELQQQDDGRDYPEYRELRCSELR
jgi:hypothetical protein